MRPWAQQSQQAQQAQQAAAAGLGVPARAGTGACVLSHIFHSLGHSQNCYLKPAAGFQQRSPRL